MARLVLIRHSLPRIEPDVPSRRWRLSSEGRLRCEWLAHGLAGLQVGQLVTSAEAKAIETAALTGDTLGLALQPVDGLQENDRAGFSFIADRAGFKQRIREFFDNPGTSVLGQETADQAFGRFLQAVSRLADTAPHDSIGIVSHGVVISLFVSRFNAVPAFDIWMALNPLPAYVVLRLPDYQIVTPPVAYPKIMSAQDGPEE